MSWSSLSSDFCLGPFTNLKSTPLSMQLVLCLLNSCRFFESSGSPLFLSSLSMAFIGSLLWAAWFLLQVFAGCSLPSEVFTTWARASSFGTWIAKENAGYAATFEFQMNSTFLVYTCAAQYFRLSSVEGSSCNCASYHSQGFQAN